jgi:hypothetical protein
MVRSLLFALVLGGCPGKEDTGDDTGVPAGEQDNDADGYKAADDCNDDDAAIFPGAVEVCNNLDDDCDQLADEEATDRGTFYADADGDGHGDAANVTVTCDQPTASSLTGGDCDDTNGAINPDATELCDALDEDEDCDGASDDDDTTVDTTSATTWYVDGDTDGYGDTSTAFFACDAAAGRSAMDGDCDDMNADINPDATEVCDAADTDEDCDGQIDDADDSLDATDASTWYLDSDADGFGATSNTIAACDLPAGYAGNDDDCDDDNGGISPDATEACDRSDIDEDCDGVADNEDDSATGLSTWYADLDEDGFGDPSNTAQACDLVDGYTTDATDCDDDNIARYPGATEQCDGLANDCDTAGTWTDDSEAGVVSWIDAFGGWTSETANFESTYAWAAPGDGELVFCEGTYYANLETNGYDVLLTGLLGSASTTLSANGSGSVVDVSGGSATIEGLTLMEGAATSGGGVHCLAATLTLDDVTVASNVATSYGGGVFLQSCPSATVTSSEIASNDASSGGGIYATNSDGLTLVDTTVRSNTATVLGGGLAASASDFTLTSSVLDANQVGHSYVGGGIWASTSTGALSDSDVTGNSAGRGAGWYLSQATLTLSGGEVSSNEADSYGAIGYVYDASTVSATAVDFVSNVSTGSLGALHNESSTVGLTSCTFDANTGDDGVLTVAGTGITTVTTSTFTNSSPYDAYAYGAGYWLSASAAYICTASGGCY